MNRSTRTRRGAIAGLAGIAACLVLGALIYGPRIVAHLRPVSPPAALGDQPPVISTTVDSKALGHPMPVEVWVPAGTDPAARLPILYLFHGVGGNASSWFGGAGGDGVGVAGIARDLVAAGRIRPLVIVSAGIDNSYGVDSSPADDGYDHGAYGTYLATELIPAIEARFPVSSSSADRYIGGLSMGAFAAAHRALRQPGDVAGVGLLSPAVFLDLPADRAWQYGGDPANNDPLRLAATADVGGWRVFVGAGADDYDWILASTPVLVQRLRAGGAAVEQRIVPGGHEVATWRALAGPMLEWLVGTGQIPGVGP
jgi:enterochelin esterase-like enzyme